MKTHADLMVHVGLGWIPGFFIGMVLVGLVLFGIFHFAEHEGDNR